MFSCFDRMLNTAILNTQEFFIPMKRSDTNPLKEHIQAQQTDNVLRHNSSYTNTPDVGCGVSRLTKVVVIVGIIAALLLFASAAAAAVYFGLPIIAALAAGTLLVTYALPIMITTAALGLLLLCSFALTLKSLLLLHERRDMMNNFAREEAAKKAKRAQGAEI